MTSFLPEGKRIDTVENANALSSFEQMRTAMERGDILEARAVLCDHDHNLKVDLPCMRGVIPREEGALGILAELEDEEPRGEERRGGEEEAEEAFHG